MMIRIKTACLFFLAFLLGVCGFSGLRAQGIVPIDSSRKVIQFSGMVVDADSLYALPYVAIVIRNKNRGVYSNSKGYYSMAVQEHDTIDFYTLGYHRSTFVLPDTFATCSQINHLQAMRLDTILLREAVIYPWPSKDEFKHAFLTLDVPTDDLTRARQNLARADVVQAAQTIAMDGGMVYSQSMRQQAIRQSTTGQYPTTSLLNPVAWAQFLQTLNSGGFKRQ